MGRGSSTVTPGTMEFLYSKAFASEAAAAIAEVDASPALVVAVVAAVEAVVAEVEASLALVVAVVAAVEAVLADEAADVAEVAAASL